MPRIDQFVGSSWPCNSVPLALLEPAVGHPLPSVCFSECSAVGVVFAGIHPREIRDGSACGSCTGLWEPMGSRQAQIGRGNVLQIAPWSAALVQAGVPRTQPGPWFTSPTVESTRKWLHGCPGGYTSAAPSEKVKRRRVAAARAPTVTWRVLPLLLWLLPRAGRPLMPGSLRRSRLVVPGAASVVLATELPGLCCRLLPLPPATPAGAGSAAVSAHRAVPVT